MDEQDLTSGLERPSESILATRIALEFGMAAREQPAMMMAAMLKLFPDLGLLLAEEQRIKRLLQDANRLAVQTANEVRELVVAVHRDLDDLGRRLAGLKDRFDRAAKHVQRLEKRYESERRGGEQGAGGGTQSGASP